MLLAMCNEVFVGWDWESSCRAIGEAGYDGVEIAPFTLAEDVRTLGANDRQQIKETALRSGLEVVGLHWLLLKPEGLDLNSADGAVRQRAYDYLTDLVHFCSDLGGQVMTLGSPRQRNLRPGVSAEQAVEWMIQSMPAVADCAADRGIVLCLEPLPPEDTNFLNTLAEVAAVVEHLGRPALRLALDVKSMASEGPPVPQLIRTYGRLAAHFHANDTNRRGPGAGPTDYAPIFKALRDTGYHSYLSVEPFDYSPDPETVARSSWEYLHRFQT